MKHLVGKRVTKSVKFMGEDVKIAKLSLADVEEIRELSKDIQESKDEDRGMEILRKVVRSSVEGAVDVTDEEFKGFPMDELTKLSDEIMKHSGISTGAPEKSGK